MAATCSSIAPLPTLPDSDKDWLPSTQHQSASPWAPLEPTSVGNLWFASGCIDQDRRIDCKHVAHLSPLHTLTPQNLSVEDVLPDWPAIPAGWISNAEAEALWTKTPGQPMHDQNIRKKHKIEPVCLPCPVRLGFDFRSGWCCKQFARKVQAACLSCCILSMLGLLFS